jgi:exopolysaccharide production protein ExoQ
MTAATWTPNANPLLGERPAIAAAPTWALGTALVIVLAFFVVGHDLNTSRAVAYTQTVEEMEITAAGGNSLRRLAFLVVGVWGLVLLALGKQPWRVDPLLAGSIGLLLGLIGMSFLWADDPGMCLRRMLALIACTVAALGIARAFSLREIAWLAVWTLGALALLGIAAELRLGTFRPWVGDYRFAGTVHPNTQGPALATLCLATIGLARQPGRQRIWLWMVCAAAFGLLLLTKSRTTTAAIFLSIGAVQLLQTRVRTTCAAVVGLTWLAAAALWTVWIGGFDPPTDFRDAFLLGRAAESDTLSGRAFIWAEVMYFANQRIWLGYGYESFWTSARIDTISSNLGWGVREAHCAYLDVLLSLGLVGLAALVVVITAGLIASIRGWLATRDPAYALPIGLLVFGLLNGGLESGMVVINLVPFLLGCCLLRLALFRDVGVGWDKRAEQAPAHHPLANYGGPSAADHAARGSRGLVPPYRN